MYRRSVVLLLVLAGIAAACTAPTDINTESSETFFAVGEVAHLPDLGIYIVVTPLYGVVAFEDRDPRSDCPLDYTSAEYWTEQWTFSDRCHGSKYSLNGTYLAGPSPRSLTPFPTYVSNGELFIESDPQFIRRRNGTTTDEREPPTFLTSTDQP